MMLNKITALTAAAILALCPIAHAQEQTTSIIDKAQTYFENLKTTKARFRQTAWDGGQIIGTFYLSRPGRLRFEYDAPIQDFIVADGTFIYFYDSQIQEQSSAPIGQTLAYFLLRDDIDLKNGTDVKVAEITEKGPLTTIKLVRTGDEGAGSITLGFQNDPFELSKWRIVDAQNMITEVELFRMESNIELDKKLFFYRNPSKKRTLND